MLVIMADGISLYNPATFHALNRYDDSLWYYTCCTVGLCKINDFFLETPYILPYFFTIHELARKKGSGVAIALFDEAMASYHTAYIQGILKGSLTYSGICPNAIITLHPLHQEYTCFDELAVFLNTTAIDFDLWLFPCTITQEKINNKNNISISALIIAAGNPENSSYDLYNYLESLATFYVYSHDRHMSSDTARALYCHKKGVIYAPGKLIGAALLDAALPNYYSIQSGTSCATAIAGGLYALVLGEFKHVWSRKTIKKLLYRIQQECFTHRYMSLIDMRITLLSMHVLSTFIGSIAKEALGFFVSPIVSFVMRPLSVLLFDAWCVKHSFPRYQYIQCTQLKELAIAFVRDTCWFYQ